jgi:hypothetical protein
MLVWYIYARFSILGKPNPRRSFFEPYNFTPLVLGDDQCRYLSAFAPSQTTPSLGHTTQE